MRLGRTAPISSSACASRTCMHVCRRALEWIEFSKAVSNELYSCVRLLEQLVQQRGQVEQVYKDLLNMQADFTLVSEGGLSESLDIK